MLPNTCPGRPPQSKPEFPMSWPGKKGVARLEQGGVTALRPFPKLGMMAGENIVEVALLRMWD